MTVGVHPAEAIVQGAIVDRVPTYVARDVDPQLHTAFRQAVFVTLVGESAAGKTRAAFEAVKALRPESFFVAPSTRESLEVLVENFPTAGKYVIWLDDLERFLGPGGLTTSMLSRLLMLQSEVKIMATMRSHEYSRYRNRAEPGATGAAQEFWRQGRDVLRQSVLVHMERRWSMAEVNRARAFSGDVRLARALRGNGRFGVAEVLAAGPELVEVWQQAWSSGRHPRGAALVAAAVDARRAGYHRPLPADVLQRLHETYLVGADGIEWHSESFEEALLWALTPTTPTGGNSLLLGAEEPGYIAFDYLIDIPGTKEIPEVVWSAILDIAPVHEGYLIACNALLADFYAPAIPALQRAALAGVGEAERILLELGIPVRSADQSLALTSQRWRNLRSDLGEDHHDCLEAESLVASFALHSGRYDEAYEIYAGLIARVIAHLGDDHPLALGVRFGLALCVFLSRSREEGLRLMDAALRDSVVILGPQHVAVLDRQKWAVRVLIDAGCVSEARQRFPALRDSSRHLPLGHPHAVEVRQLADRLRGE
ncbi:hypothetical protein ACWDCO_02325 [Streptomyces albogriseolus]